MRAVLRVLKTPVFNLCYRILMSSNRSTSISGRTPYGMEDLKFVHQVLRSRKLSRTVGKMVLIFEKEFAHAYNAAYGVASTSGTSSVHVALGALDLNPGDEVITTPITDMGTIIPILAQNAVPIFADIDETYNISPAAIESCISERTKAIIAVHTFGNPCDMDGIMALSRRYKLPVVEDCSQAHMTMYKGRLLGSIGDMGCFSLHESKHLTTGDGGMTITSQTAYHNIMRLFVDKGFDRETGAASTSRYLFYAPNYRMPELTAAVGLAQLKKVSHVVRRRNHLGTMLSNLLSDIDGVRPAPVTPGATHSYWAYPLYLETIDVNTFVTELKGLGIPAAVHMSTPLYLSAKALSTGCVYGSSRCPFLCARPGIEYRKGDCPEAERLTEHLVALWLTENWSEDQIGKTAASIQSTVRKLQDNHR